MGYLPIALKTWKQDSNLQHSEKPKNSKPIQLSADFQQQSESTLVDEGTNQDETENGPLWTMYFDGSCTKSTAGAGVWIINTENNHI